MTNGRKTATAAVLLMNAETTPTMTMIAISSTFGESPKRSSSLPSTLTAPLRCNEALSTNTAATVTVA